MRIRTIAASLCASAVVVSLGAFAPVPAAQPSTPAPTPGAMPNAVPSAITPSVNNGDVRAIAQVGNTVVIGGKFTTVNTLARNHLAAMDATTGALSAFAVPVDGPVYAVVPGPNDHSVYIGGAFGNVGGTTVTDLALVDLTTGAVVPTFKAPVTNFGQINDLVVRGNRLYLGGTFTKVGGAVHNGLAALNATTGALDPFMNVQLTGHHNDSGSGAQGAVGPWGFDVTADGSRMVVQGNFKKADGLLRDQVVMINLTGPVAAVRTDWATQRYAPYCFSGAFDSYVRGISFSPDGSYFVVAATGGGVQGTLCDAVSRFETNGSGQDIQPTWVNETGGDTVWAVAITDTAVFVGGHQRWSNNPTGSDFAGPGAVPRPGLEALDPVSGRPLTWNPGRNPPGTAVYALLATPKGLWMGSNTDFVGNRRYKRMKIVYFPYQGGVPLASTSTATLPGTAYLGGKRAAGTTNVLYRVNAGGGAIQSTDSGPDWAADNDASPSALHNAGSNTAGWSPVGSVTANVPSSTPSAIFGSERWDPGSPNDGGEMDWKFPVPAGTPVEVRVYLANRCTCTSAVGSRVFSVNVDGQAIATNEDLVADVGDQVGTMKKTPQPITVGADGLVDVTFLHNVENTLVNGIEIVRTDVTPTQGNTDTFSKAAFDGTTAVPGTASGGDVLWGSARGAAKIGNRVFYGMTDGYLHYRTYAGTTFGPDVKVDPYHDPVWKDVSNNLGGTFDGNLPTFYSQIPNVTGMFYTKGRMYYTLFGDSVLHSRWFSPDSGIIDETEQQSPGLPDFANAAGMFLNGGDLYYATRGDGNLHKVAFSDGNVTGVPVVVNGPLTGGINWDSRALFLG